MVTMDGHDEPALGRGTDTADQERIIKCLEEQTLLIYSDLNAFCLIIFRNKHHYVRHHGIQSFSQQDTS